MPTEYSVAGHGGELDFADRIFGHWAAKGLTHDHYTVEPLYNSLFCPGQLANYKRVANYMKQSFFLYNRHQNYLS